MAAPLTKKEKERRKKYVQLVSETGDKEAALIEVYGKQNMTHPKHVTKKAESYLAHPVAVKEILGIWQQAGITLDLASARHLWVLTSSHKKIKAADLLKAIEMTYKGYGVKGFAKDEDEEKGKSILEIFLRQREERGLSEIKPDTDPTKNKDAQPPTNDE